MANNNTPTKIVSFKIDEDLHRELKSKAYLAGKNLPQFASDLLSKGIRSEMAKLKKI